MLRKCSEEARRQLPGVAHAVKLGKDSRHAFAALSPCHCWGLSFFSPLRALLAIFAFSFPSFIFRRHLSTRVRCAQKVSKNCLKVPALHFFSFHFKFNFSFGFVSQRAAVLSA